MALEGKPGPLMWHKTTTMQYHGCEKRITLFLVDTPSTFTHNTAMSVKRNCSTPLPVYVVSSGRQVLDGCVIPGVR